MELTHFNLEAYNALLQLRRDRKIGWRAVGLGSTIASFANKDTGEAWPSRATLKLLTGIEETDASRVIRELKDAGFMAVEEREGRSNVYRLTHGEIATGGKQPPSGKQPPTHGDLASKPMGKQPPITMKEQSSNNEGQNNEKPPSCSDLSKEQSIRQKAKHKIQKPKVTMTSTGFAIPDAIRQTWATAYPGVNIDRETAKALAWCQNNPRKAPKKDYGRFLNSWLGRATPSMAVGNSSATGDLSDLGYKGERVEQKHGPDVARRYDQKARELGSTMAADRWLGELLKTGAAV